MAKVQREVLQRQAVIDQLYRDLAEALTKRTTAQWRQDPFEAAFQAEHQALVGLPHRPRVTKAQRLAAYDRRMRAGHAWHPHREHLKRINRWITAIRKELEDYE